MVWDEWVWDDESPPDDPFVPDEEDGPIPKGIVPPIVDDGIGNDGRFN